MIIINKKRLPKKLIAIGIVAILLLTAPFVYIYALNGNMFGWKANQNPKSDNSTKDVDNINYDPATKEQQDTGNQTKSNSSDTPLAPTTIPDSDKKNVQVTITSANQNGSTLQIRSLIGAVGNTGTCTLTLTSTGQSAVTKTATIQALASTSTCQGFDIPTSDLSIGTWNILIEFSSDTLTGSATMDKVIK